MVTPNQFITSKELLDWNIEFNLGLNQMSVKKGKVFLEEGQKCNYFYFVLKGIVRLYYYDLDGHEITHLFSSENTMITAPFSYFKNEPNDLYLQALEDTELLIITLEQLNTIFKKIDYLGARIRDLYLEYILLFSRRVMSIHTKTAEQRYLKLMDSHPYLFQQAKLTHIASYLGITIQSLSRIRKNLLR
ncbi:MAG: Crp/Fnr family transcriptional regulator [Bacteroidota bacterium]